MIHPYVVGHQSIDGDCATALWLLGHFGDARFSQAEVKFVHTGTPDADILANAMAVVDTGKVYDPATLRFDHHLAGEFFADKSATLLVWMWLQEQAQLAEDQHQMQQLNDIRPLVDIINECDTGSKTPAAITSRTVGLHAMISGLKRAGVTDDHFLLSRIAGLLESLAINLIAQGDARRELAAKTKHEERNGLIIWLNGASSTASHLAMEQGAKAIFFTGEERDSSGRTSYPRGIQVDPDFIGADKLIALAISIAETNAWDETAIELRTWWVHPQRFFAGKGTRKAPCYTPIGEYPSVVWCCLSHAFMVLHNEIQGVAPCE